MVSSCGIISLSDKGYSVYVFLNCGKKLGVVFARVFLLNVGLLVILCAKLGFEDIFYVGSYDSGDEFLEIALILSEVNLNGTDFIQIGNGVLFIQKSTATVRKLLRDVGNSKKICKCRLQFYSCWFIYLFH